jgi:hypothetical protein
MLSTTYTKIGFDCLRGAGIRSSRDTPITRRNVAYSGCEWFSRSIRRSGRFHGRDGSVQRRQLLQRWVSS